MTKQFCDVCGQQIYGNNKFNVTLGNGANEFDVCPECRKAFEKGREQADILVFKERHK